MTVVPYCERSTVIDRERPHATETVHAARSPLGKCRQKHSGVTARTKAPAKCLKFIRELEIPFWLGVTLLEHAELSGSDGSRAEARAIFERLQATPWVERADAGSPALAARAR